MRLREIRELIDRADTRDEWSFSGDDFFETLVVVFLPEAEMTAPFHGDFDIDAPFILVYHLPHVPETVIRAFVSRQQLEKELVGTVISPFVGHSFAFVDGVLCPFRVLYQDHSGADVVFSKVAQQTAGGFSADFPGARLEWL